MPSHFDDGWMLEDVEALERLDAKIRRVAVEHELNRARSVAQADQAIGRASDTITVTTVPPDGLAP